MNKVYVIRYINPSLNHNYVLDKGYTDVESAKAAAEDLASKDMSKRVIQDLGSEYKLIVDTEEPAIKRCVVERHIPPALSACVVEYAVVEIDIER